MTEEQGPEAEQSRPEAAQSPPEPTEPGTDGATAATPDPGTDGATAPAPEPGGTDGATAPATEPGGTDGATDPRTDGPAGPATEPATAGATAAATRPGTDGATGRTTGPGSDGATGPDQQEESSDGEGLTALLEHLRDTRGFDFTGYKRSSLTRRIRKRMDGLHVTSFDAYRRYLDLHDGEFIELFNTILINVTGFFRDPDTWELLSRVVIPRVVTERDHDEPIRAWVPGCATGEEAYSLAMLLCEALGEDVFRQRVKIYATDVDQEALSEARAGRYLKRSVADALPPAMLERYFEPDDTHIVFRKDLRRTVIYGRHDLVQDPPISRIDLLTCRNTLMYFTPAAQTRILANLHFALRPAGFLVLGRSEALATRTALFTPFDL
ncbi:MAG TPA: CheR family methyltransferase, partial [Acidimicrobiales bacterium]